MSIRARTQGDVNAAAVSDALPFVEFELHRQLLHKLRLFGFNAAFGLRFEITVGAELLVRGLLPWPSPSLRA